MFVNSAEFRYLITRTVIETATEGRLLPGFFRFMHAPCPWSVVSGQWLQLSVGFICSSDGRLSADEFISFELVA
jgi:hypothetical protein